MLIQSIVLGAAQFSASNLVTVTFNPGNIRRIEITDVGGDGYVLDDLKFQLVPEPGSFLLMGTALAALGWRFRRR